MEKTNDVQKVKWNVTNAMSCVYEALGKSKLRIKSTKQYSTAVERLTKLYGISTTQLWILCFSVERYLEDDDSTSLHNISCYLNVPIMRIMNWKEEVKKLADMGMMEWARFNEYFQPTMEFMDSLADNTVFVDAGNKKIDDTDFLRKFAQRYEKRRSENMTAYAIQRELTRMEEKYIELPVVQRTREAVEERNDRFILYDVASDVMTGGESGLDPTIADLYDGSERYTVATKMMEETHPLMKLGLLEFVNKGNLSEARFSLTSKAKRLVFGDKAFLFEDSINEKNLIKNDKIKSKQLFYSEENQREIERLKNALNDETFHKIQKRLDSEGLPTGVAVLLYGAPGTGKTESVLQIAKETGRSIVHVDISEAKSAWFGESEKRIKKIFSGYKNTCEVCERKGEKIPILLFNEADAIISKRKSDVSGNCAQTENTIQNIILEELENLKGIFIATTNLAENMDSAFERRFLFKIRFENPSKEAKASIWMNKLTWMDQKNADEFAAQYDFSGGQIDNIVRKIAMNEVITGERPEMVEIHNMCRNEKIASQNKCQKMGFGA